MTDILQVENIKLVVLFALITAIVIMSHFGAAPARKKPRRYSGTPAPAGR
jgi:hypothetical protein